MIGSMKIDLKLMSSKIYLDRNRSIGKHEDFDLVCEIFLPK